MEFKIGDSVRWESRVRNVLIRRKGKIVYIIRSFESLSEVLKTEKFKNAFNRNFNLIHNNLEEFRVEKSFLIASTKGDGQIPILYWPDKVLLKKIRIRKSKNKIKD